jgi:hypothetical protein
MTKRWLIPLCLLGLSLSVACGSRSADEGSSSTAGSALSSASVPVYLIALPGWRDPTRSWFDRLTTNGPS